EHGRPADRGHAPRSARTVRLRAGRPARDRALRGAPRPVLPRPMTDGVSLVVPTLGRPSLVHLLTALDRAGPPPMPVEVLVVDDRRNGEPLRLPPVAGAVPRLLAGGGRGPAAARNLGWRA